MDADKTVTAVFVEATVQITSADICDDSIGIQVGPSGLAGQLVVTLQAAASSHDIYNHAVSAGSFTIPFGWGSVPVGVKYTGIGATWACGAQTPNDYDCHFKNLGIYSHTQYAAPDETQTSCQSGGQVNVCFSSGPSACDKTTGTLYARFKEEATENGHGISINHGKIQLEWLCSPPPSGCTKGDDYFRENMSSFTGACGSLSATTVAINPNNTNLACGDKVCIMGHGEKTVTDKGGAEVGLTQLDHYLPSFNACDDPPDFCDDTITIKIYD